MMYYFNKKDLKLELNKLVDLLGGKENILKINLCLCQLHYYL